MRKVQFFELKICSSKYQIYMFYKDTLFLSLVLDLGFCVFAAILINVLALNKLPVQVRFSFSYRCMLFYSFF